MGLIYLWLQLCLNLKTHSASRPTLHCMVLNIPVVHLCKCFGLERRLNLRNKGSKRLHTLFSKHCSTTFESTQLLMELRVQSTKTYLSRWLSISTFPYFDSSTEIPEFLKPWICLAFYHTANVGFPAFWRVGQVMLQMCLIENQDTHYFGPIQYLIGWVVIVVVKNIFSN